MALRFADALKDWRVLAIGAALIFAGAVWTGQSLAHYAVAEGWRGGDRIENGIWATMLHAGAADADPLTRASIAVSGLLALSATETTYYSTRTDSEGRPLSSEAVYEISGGDLPARWWSLTVYNGDDFLIPNAAHRYSVRSTTLQRDPDGGFTVRLARASQQGNWIPAGEGQNMTLVLRLYNPPADIRSRLSTIELPLVRRVEAGP